MTKRSLALALSCALAGAVFTSPVLAAEPAAASQAAQEMSAAAAQDVAATLGMSVDEAVAAGEMTYDAANGSYALTQSGADKLVAKMGTSGNVPAAKMYAGMTAQELTALIAGGVGLVLVILSDEDASGSSSSSSSSSSR